MSKIKVKEHDFPIVPQVGDKFQQVLKLQCQPPY